MGELEAERNTAKDSKKRDLQRRRQQGRLSPSTLSTSRLDVADMDAAECSSPTVPTSPGVAGRRVAYISSSRLTTLASRLASNLDRSRQVHELVLAMGLISEDDDAEEQGMVRLLAPKVVGKKALTTYLDGDFAGARSPSSFPALDLFCPLDSIDGQAERSWMLLSSPDRLPARRWESLCRLEPSSLTVLLRLLKLRLLARTAVQAHKVLLP